MPEEHEWEIIYYTDERGTTPVEDFLQRLDLKTQARFDWSIERLRQLNVQAREPLVKHLEGKLWELRQASAGNIYRVVYLFYTGRQIVFLHGFQKKTQKTPRGEIEIAKKRMEDFVRREGEGE